jgi:hypothetical protein
VLGRSVVWPEAKPPSQAFHSIYRRHYSGPSGVERRTRQPRLVVLLGQAGRQTDRQTDRQIGRQAVEWTGRDTAAGRCTLQQRAMLRGSEGATCSHLSSLGELGAASPGAIGPPSCHLDSCPPPSSIPPPCRCSLFALALVLALALGLLCRPPARPSTANNVVALCCQ